MLMNSFPNTPFCRLDIRLHRWLRDFLILFYLVNTLALPVLGDEPLRTWTVDFNDPEEITRWEIHPNCLEQSPQIRWHIVPRSATDPSLGKVLEIKATGGLVQPERPAILRRLPPEFAKVPPESLMIEWEWRISDTVISDAVSLSLDCQPKPGWDPYRPSTRVVSGFASHSRFPAVQRSCKRPKRPSCQV